MSGFPYKNALDITKFRNEYLANLALQAQINDMNLQANKVYIRTGAPTQPTDTRTASEKLADLYRLRIEVRSKLGQIMSGDDANKVAESLDDNEARFLSQQLDTIVADLKPKYAQGVPADVFKQYLQRYMEKFEVTKGVDFGLQQSLGQELQQMINANMISANDITQIKDSLRAIGVSNSVLGKKIDRNLAELKNAIDTSNEAFSIINETNNPILKDQILKDITELVQDMPTSGQVNQILNQLQVAQQKGDPVAVEQAMRRINELTEYSGSLERELTSLREQLAEVKPGSELPVAEATFPTIPSVAVVPLYLKKYTYIPADTLDTYNKTGDENTINLVDYLKSMKQRTETLPQGRVLSRQLKARQEQTKGDIISTLRRQDNIVQQIWNEIGISGNGLPVEIGKKVGRMKGKGLKTMKTLDNVDYSSGMLPSANYIPFGNYLINRKKLEEGIVMIKRPSGQFMGDLRTKRVSPNVLTIFKKISGGQLPTFNDYEKLDDDEREYLQFVAKKSNLLDKLQVPSPKKDKTEQLINQFEIMRGQIIAGNDSKDMLKKFKSIIIELSERDLLPKGQVRDLLLEIMKRDV